MLDREVQLLDAGRVVGRHDQRNVGELLEVSAGFPEQRHDAPPPRFRRLRRADHVRALAARRMQHEQIARLRQRLHLAREYFVESHIVGARGQEGRIGGERDRAHRGTGGLIADDILGGDVLRVRGTAAVACKEQRTASAECRLVAVGDRGDGVRLLRRHAARERGEAVQRLPNFLDAHRAASTNALRSCLAPSSTTVPMTTKSAPAARAARACSGVRIPPPTKSGRSGGGGGTAERQARMMSSGTGRSAPLPAPKYTACMPIRSAAVACAAASPGLSAGRGPAWLPDPTPGPRPPAAFAWRPISAASTPDVRTGSTSTSKP